MDEKITNKQGLKQNNKPILSETALILISYRKKIGFTRKQLAEYIGASYRTIEKWEQGRTSCPKFVLQLIIDKLENDMTYQPSKISRFKNGYRK